MGFRACFCGWGFADRGFKGLVLGAWVKFRVYRG